MAPIRAAFPPAMVQVMKEPMSGPYTAEVVAFDRFTDFMLQHSDAARRDWPLTKTQAAPDIRLQAELAQGVPGATRKA
jgi:hypothetical protein